MDIWVFFYMQNVPLDAALLFDLHAAILGWLLAADQPKKAASAAHTVSLATILFSLLVFLLSVYAVRACLSYS